MSSQPTSLPLRGVILFSNDFSKVFLTTNKNEYFDFVNTSSNNKTKSDGDETVKQSIIRALRERTGFFPNQVEFLVEDPNISNEKELDEITTTTTIPFRGRSRGKGISIMYRGKGGRSMTTRVQGFAPETCSNGFYEILENNADNKSIRCRYAVARVKSFEEMCKSHQSLKSEKYDEITKRKIYKNLIARSEWKNVSFAIETEKLLSRRSKILQNIEELKSKSNISDWTSGDSILTNHQFNDIYYTCWYTNVKKIIRTLIWIFTIGQKSSKYVLKYSYPKYRNSNKAEQEDIWCLLDDVLELPGIKKKISKGSILKAIYASRSKVFTMTDDADGKLHIRINSEKLNFKKKNSDRSANNEREKADDESDSEDDLDELYE